MKDFPSPMSYIDFGFYYLISAALQRRVWIGPDHAKLYTNMYTILVGNPGVGKGLVINQIANLLKLHKLEDPANLPKPSMENAEAEVERILKEANFDRAQDTSTTKKLGVDKPLLIPVAADASTYEALIRAMSRAIRRINYKEFDETLQKQVLRIYTHSSLCFCLEEISSLFRKRTEDLVNFLIRAYDCGDYEYDTKTQGRDRIFRCCLNFFGGTTPSFMQDTFNDKLLSEGFASRTVFIFEYANRFPMLWLPDLNDEQKEAWADIAIHVKALSELYGGVIISQEAQQFLEHWWKVEASHTRPNRSPKLNAYYARKNIHVLKLACAVHFAESLSMTIERQPFETALKMLDSVEAKMHYAIGFDNKNPLSAPAKKIQEYIKVFGPQTFKELLLEFWGDIREPELREILNFLMGTGKVKTIEPKEGCVENLKYELI